MHKEPPYRKGLDIIYGQHDFTSQAFPFFNLCPKQKLKVNGVVVENEAQLVGIPSHAVEMSNRCGVVSLERSSGSIYMAGKPDRISRNRLSSQLFSQTIPLQFYRKAALSKTRQTDPGNCKATLLVVNRPMEKQKKL